MPWDRDQVNAAARAYRARHREKVLQRDRERSKTPEFKARKKAWRQANAEALREADRKKRRRSIAPTIARQEAAARRRQRFLTAMVPSFEEVQLEHESWLESIDLWRMAEAYEHVATPTT